MSKTVNAKAWSGVFNAETDPRVEKFTESISFDQRLAEQDIRGSTAHAQMLAEVGIISQEECLKIVHCLNDIRTEIQRGEFPFRTELEDIHMHIERALIERLGDIGRKLHTARSRNDQISTDFRLWVRDAIDELDALLKDVQTAFVGRCDGDLDVILPAYTHLQRAQPVLAPHYWLAYAEKFDRDRERLADCRKRTNRSPLGCAALAGTSLPIDRTKTEQALGFQGRMLNSLDAVSDRDFAVEFVFALSVIATHLSTFAEEWILWSTSEFQFLKLPQQFCTGSSIMPQKINPDVLEIIRGKTGRVHGSLTTLLTLLKGLPLAYNRDLQEDKPPVFDAFDTVKACLELTVPMVAGAELQRDAITGRLAIGYLDATTLMEALIREGIPQRSAHELVGKIVRLGLDRGEPLENIPLEEMQAIDARISDRVVQVLGVSQALSAFVSEGSTSPEQVKEQISVWKRKLGINI